MAIRDEKGATAVRYSYSSFIWLQIGMGLLGNGEAKQQPFFLLPKMVIPNFFSRERV